MPKFGPWSVFAAQLPINGKLIMDSDDPTLPKLE